MHSGWWWHREIEAIATNGKADAVEFFLGGADVGQHACIGYLEIGRDASFINKKNRVSSGRHAGTNTLGKMSEDVGKSENPSGAVRATNQVAILEGLANNGVDDNV